MIMDLDIDEFAQALEAMRAKNFMHASRILGRLINTNQSDVTIIMRALDLRAACWEALDNFEAAVCDARAMLSRQPSDHRGALRLGKIYRMMGQPERAILVYKTFLALQSPSSPYPMDGAVRRQLEIVLRKTSTYKSVGFQSILKLREPFESLPNEIVKKIFRLFSPDSKTVISTALPRLSCHVKIVGVSTTASQIKSLSPYTVAIHCASEVSFTTLTKEINAGSFRSLKSLSFTALNFKMRPILSMPTLCTLKFTNCELDGPHLLSAILKFTRLKCLHLIECTIERLSLIPCVSKSDHLNNRMTSLNEIYPIDHSNQSSSLTEIISISNESIDIATDPATTNHNLDSHSTSIFQSARNSNSIFSLKKLIIMDCHLDASRALINFLRPSIVVTNVHAALSEEACRKSSSLICTNNFSTTLESMKNFDEDYPDHLEPNQEEFTRDSTKASIHMIGANKNVLKFYWDTEVEAFLPRKIAVPQSLILKGDRLLPLNLKVLWIFADKFDVEALRRGINHFQCLSVLYISCRLIDLEALAKVLDYERFPVLGEIGVFTTPGSNESYRGIDCGRLINLLSPSDSIVNPQKTHSPKSKKNNPNEPQIKRLKVMGAPIRKTKRALLILPILSTLSADRRGTLLSKYPTTRIIADPQLAYSIANRHWHISKRPFDTNIF